jgi:5-methylcytosine-specific restriction endonuclease McrA
MTEQTATEKTCSDCGMSKPAEDFYVHKQTRDGRHPYCKACCAVRGRRNYQRNTGRQARRKAYYAAHREEAKSAAKAWAAANRDRVLACRQQYLESHREQEKQRARRWSAANPDRVKHNNRLRKARSKGATVCTLTLIQWEAIVAAYGGRCAYCGCLPAHLQMDHVVPLRKGGQHTAENVVPACRPCNARKYDKPAPEFTRIPVSQILHE